MVSPNVSGVPDNPILSQIGLADFPDAIKYNTGIINVPRVNPENINQMLRIDGQVAGLYRLLTIPLRGASVEIQRNNMRANREADFIREVLTEPYVKGGMIIPLGTVIATILKMLIDGWSPHEIVWNVRDGFVRVDKIDYRPINTITPKLDNYNNLDSYDQDLSRIDIKKFKTPNRIVNIDSSKIMHFVNGPEWNSIFGRPLFLQAYYHYEKKHKLYYISHIAAQINALRLRVLKVPENRKQHVDKYLELVSKLGFNSTIHLPDDVILELLDVGNNFPDILPLMNHHDSQAAKSVLAQVIDVGMDSRTGSFNLSDTHFDIFIENLKLMGDYIANIFNSVLIPKLIDWNFGTGNYPKIVFNPFDRQIKKLLFEIYIRIIGSANLNVTPEFILEIEEAVSKTIGLNVSYQNTEEYLEILKEKMAKAGSNESSSGSGDPDSRDRSDRN